MPSNLSTQDPDFYKKRSSKLRQRDFAVEISTWDFSTSSQIIKWHWHDEIEFIYVQSGEVYITCEEDNILAYEGDIVFVNHETKHFMTPAGDNECVLKNVVVNPSFIIGYGHLDMAKKYITPVIHSSTCRYILISKNHSNYEIFKHYIDDIIQLNTTKRECYELLIQADLLVLWKYIFNHVCIIDSQKSLNENHIKTSQDEQRVKQAIIYIQEHYTEPITLEDIASSILVSKSECCRCFKRSMNMTPFEYLMKYRILESTKRMRRKGHETVSEIAGSVGFNNTSYYNKIFRKYMGCTPTEFKHNKNDIPSFF